MAKRLTGFWVGDLVTFLGVGVDVNGGERTNERTRGRDTSLLRGCIDNTYHLPLTLSDVNPSMGWDGRGKRQDWDMQGNIVACTCLLPSLVVLKAMWEKRCEKDARDEMASLSCPVRLVSSFFCRV